MTINTRFAGVLKLNSILLPINLTSQNVCLFTFRWFSNCYGLNPESVELSVNSKCLR